MEAGSPAHIPACMLELSDFVFSLIPVSEVRELPAWTRQPGYTADLLTCFSPGLPLSCQKCLHRFSLFELSLLRKELKQVKGLYLPQSSCDP